MRQKNLDDAKDDAPLPSFIEAIRVVDVVRATIRVRQSLNGLDRCDGVRKAREDKVELLHDANRHHAPVTKASVNHVGICALTLAVNDVKLGKKLHRYR